MYGEGLCPECPESPGVRDQETSNIQSVCDRAGQVWEFSRKGCENTRSLAFLGSQIQPRLHLPVGLAETSLRFNWDLTIPWETLSPHLPPKDAWF